MVGDPKERVTVEVPEGLDGVRADRAIAHITGLPRSAVRELIGSGGATIAGAPIGRRDPLAAGTRVDMAVPDLSPKLTPEPVAFSVLYEDPDIAVVDKPAGLVVHPGAGNASGTLAHGLLHRWPGIEGVGEPGRWGIVHRLDRETSGAIAVAKTVRGYEGLKSLVDRRELERHYLALVHGRPELPTGTIDAPIGRDTRHPTRMRIQPEGRRSVTHYILEEELGRYSFMRVALETGRTHQIRVHLASIDLQIVGDRVYGRPGSPDVDPGRVWLHASVLRFDHPVSGDPVDVTAPLPSELQASLVAARGHD